MSPEVERLAMLAEFWRCELVNRMCGDADAKAGSLVQAMEKQKWFSGEMAGLVIRFNFPDFEKAEAEISEAKERAFELMRVRGTPVFGETEHAAN